MNPITVRNSVRLNNYKTEAKHFCLAENVSIQPIA